MPSVNARHITSNPNPTPNPQPTPGTQGPAIAADVQLEVLKHNYNQLIYALKTGREVTLKKPDGSPEDSPIRSDNLQDNLMRRDGLIGTAERESSRLETELESRDADNIVADKMLDQSQSNFRERKEELARESAQIVIEKKHLEELKQKIVDTKKHLEEEQAAVGNILKGVGGLFDTIFKERAEKIRGDAQTELTHSSFADPVARLAEFQTPEARALEAEYLELVTATHPNNKNEVARRAETGRKEAEGEMFADFCSSPEYSKAFAAEYHDSKRRGKDLAAQLKTDYEASPDNQSRVNRVLLASGRTQKLLEDFRTEDLVGEPEETKISELRRKVGEMLDGAKLMPIEVIPHENFKSSNFIAKIEPMPEWKSDPRDWVGRAQGLFQEAGAIAVKGFVPGLAAAAAATGILAAVIPGSFAYSGLGVAGPTTLVSFGMPWAIPAAIGFGLVVAGGYCLLAAKSHLSDFTARDKIFREHKLWTDSTQARIDKMHEEQLRSDGLSPGDAGWTSAPSRATLLERSRKRMMLYDIGVLDAPEPGLRAGEFRVVNKKSPVETWYDPDAKETKLKVDMTEVKFTSAAQRNRNWTRALTTATTGAFWGTLAAVGSNALIPGAGIVAGVAVGVLTGFNQQKRYTARDDEGNIDKNKVTEDLYVRRGIEQIYRMDVEESEIRALAARYNGQIKKWNEQILAGEIKEKSEMGGVLKKAAKEYKAEVEELIQKLDGRDSGAIATMQQDLRNARMLNVGWGLSNADMAWTLVESVGKGAGVGFGVSLAAAAAGSAVAFPAALAVGSLFAASQATNVLMQRMKPEV